MDVEFPPELAALLDGGDPASREQAWSLLLERHSSLLLKAAGTFGPDHDRKMDRYQFIIERLHADDFRRLRSYRAQPESGFASWLLVVARRLCLDYERRTYGRGKRAADPDRSERERAARRRLVELVGVSLDPAERLPASDGTDPEQRLRETELTEALEATLATLAPRDRLLLKLRFEDGRSVREIADVMRFPSVFHVYRRLKTVLEEARERLQARGIGGSAP
jgi:RNA polymerase sigma factor (sigma-70 family)